jgi:hypothetical protein
VPHLTRRAWLAVGLAIAGLAALSVTIAGAQTDDTPRGTDPLSADELSAATDLARGSNPGEAAGLGEDDVVLLVERHEEAKAAEDDGLRRADVYVYSYDDDVLTWSIVDTATGEVDHTEVVRNTQLPLIQEEEDRALGLALDDPEFAQLLATRYRQATGRDLTDPATDLDIQPIVFRADANPAAAAAGARACGRHRCAQLMIQSTDDLLVDLLPVIDLSTGDLLSETGFFS